MRNCDRHGEGDVCSLAIPWKGTEEHTVELVTEISRLSHNSAAPSFGDIVQ